MRYMQNMEETLIEILEGLEMEFYLDDKEVKNPLKYFTIEYIGYWSWAVIINEAFTIIEREE